MARTEHPHTTSPLEPGGLQVLLQPLQAFLAAESAGGLILIFSTVIALVWANSPWHESYHSLWHLPIALGIGSWSLNLSLELFINDGLMAVFFLLVGLEIKREICMGELRSIQRASLPVVAAMGGMIVPALIFLAFNVHGPGVHGWGIPMATDIAFAVGVLALVGRGLPTSVRIFLLAVAIVDDLGAVLVIALFYTSQVHWLALAIAGGLFAALLLLNAIRVYSPLPYMLLGLALWLAMFYSGVHATVAGVLLALAIPARRRIEEQPYVDYARQMLDTFASDIPIEPTKITPLQSYALKGLEEASQAVQTPLARVEHALLRTVTLGIVPLFALANAGVDLISGIGPALHDPILPGVALGLLLGKPIGVLSFSWLACQAGIARLPEGASWRHLFGVAVLCGVGFTMSLFIANLAFEGNAVHLSATKVGVLAASLLSGVAGGAIVAFSRKPR